MEVSIWKNQRSKKNDIAAKHSKTYPGPFQTSPLFMKCSWTFQSCWKRITQLHALIFHVYKHLWFNNHQNHLDKILKAAILTYGELYLALI